MRTVQPKETKKDTKIDLIYSGWIVLIVLVEEEAESKKDRQALKC